MGKIKGIGLGIWAIIIPTAYAVLLRLVFGIDNWRRLFSVMTISFIVLMPAIMGVLTVYFSKEEKRIQHSYRIFAPWVPLFIFVLITLTFAWEGWACWLMVLPIFLVTSSLGGLLGGYLGKSRDQNKVNISLISLLPLLLAPFEKSLESNREIFKADTYIDIKASPETIWSNVTRVKEIPEHKDHLGLTRFMGFPRPIKAELDFEGIGASREAIFTKGLVFHEIVSEYIPNKKMVFSIKAHPHEIPSATMDDHIVIGGEFFDVLEGVYYLEKLDKQTFRLHLTSKFSLKTHFNFYAGWWAEQIMKDIQDNILLIQKERSESI